MSDALTYRAHRNCFLGEIFSDKKWTSAASWRKGRVKSCIPLTFLQLCKALLLHQNKRLRSVSCIKSGIMYWYTETPIGFGWISGGAVDRSLFQLELRKLLGREQGKRIGECRWGVVQAWWASILPKINHPLSVCTHIWAKSLAHMKGIAVWCQWFHDSMPKWLGYQDPSKDPAAWFLFFFFYLCWLPCVAFHVFQAICFLFA